MTQLDKNVLTMKKLPYNGWSVALGIMAGVGWGMAFTGLLFSAADPSTSGTNTVAFYKELAMGNAFAGLLFFLVPAFMISFVRAIVNNRKLNRMKRELLASMETKAA